MLLRFVSKKEKKLSELEASNMVKFEVLTGLLSQEQSAVKAMAQQSSEQGFCWSAEKSELYLRVSWSVERDLSFK